MNIFMLVLVAIAILVVILLLVYSSLGRRRLDATSAVLKIAINYMQVGRRSSYIHVRAHAPGELTAVATGSFAPTSNRGHRHVVLGQTYLAVEFRQCSEVMSCSLTDYFAYFIFHR